MMCVDLKDYPKPREWHTRVFTMPNIPRAKGGMLETLKIILTALKDNISYNSVLEIPGSKRKLSLDKLCMYLRPSGIVHKTNQGWILSDEINIWLQSYDNQYLTAFLSSNIRFVAELLVHLDKPMKTGELQAIAVNQYHLSWKANSEINNRLIWLRDLGLVEYHDYKLVYTITDQGKHFLNHISPTRPEDITFDADITINEVDMPVSQWAIDICNMKQNCLQNRKPSIGYIPGNIDDVPQTMTDYMLLIESGTTLEIFGDYAQKTHDIATTSARTFVTTLTTLNFIERKSRTFFGLTDLGKQWLYDNSILNLICCLHTKFLFVFEILGCLLSQDMTVKQLTAIAQVSYGFPREDTAEISRRVHFLENSLLIQETGKGIYSLTERGKRLISSIHVQEPSSQINFVEEQGSIEKDSDLPTLDNDLAEIRLAARDSSNSDRFEYALEKGFSLLGFKAKRIGGAGKTDVLLNAPSAPKYAYVITVDAKTTASGGITEGLINFDTINDHKKIHHADYAVIVGCSFQGNRLIERAIKHKIALLCVDDLEKMIRLHAEIPLQSNSYKKIFCNPGLVDVSLLEEDRQKIKKNGILLQSIMGCLSEESSDPVTEGILQIGEIYQNIKSNKQFEYLLTLDEIKSMLDFLSSPLIGCIGSVKEGYYALGSLSDAAKKFGFYEKACSIV